MTTRKRPIEPLTRSEADSLLRACGRGPAGIRNRALIAVLWRGGLRLGEGLALLPKDIEETAAGVVVHVLRGKGAKRRVVGLDSAGAALCQAWMAERSRLGISPKRRLFCTISKGLELEPGHPLHEQYVRQLLARLAKRAGVEKRVHPHGLRHTHTRELDEEGLPIRMIADQLGHEHISTTSRYLASYGATERVERMSERPGW